MVDGGWMGSDKCGIQVLHFQHFNCIVQYKQVDTNYNILRNAGYIMQYVEYLVNN